MDALWRHQNAGAGAILGGAHIHAVRQIDSGDARAKVSGVATSYVQLNIIVEKKLVGAFQILAAEIPRVVG